MSEYYSRNMQKKKKILENANCHMISSSIESRREIDAHFVAAT